MALSFIAVVIALLWLFHRVTRILRIPVPYLIQTLGIDIPDIPTITLDSVTSNTILFHWSSPEKNVVRLMFWLNGKRAGGTDRLNSAVLLKGLRPNTNYTLSVVAINPNNYQSHASITRFHTQHPLNEYNEVNQNPLESLMASDNTAASLLSINIAIAASIRQNPKSRKRSQTTTAPGKSRDTSLKTQSNSKPKTDSKTKNANEPVEPYTVESLTSEIEAMHVDLQEAIAAKAEQEKQFSDEENTLIKLLEETQAQRKSEETVRSQLRSDNKALEDTRHNLENEKSNIERTYKKLKDSTSRRYQQMEKWQAEMEEADKNLKRSDDVIAGMSKKYELDVSQKKEEMVNIKKEVTSIEKEVKKLNTEVKKLQAARTATLQSIEELKKKSDPNNGVVSEEVLKNVTSQNVCESLKEAISKETEIETEVENKWVDDQKELEKRYLVTYKQFQDANSAHQRALEVYKEYAIASPADSQTTNNGMNTYSNTMNQSTGKRRRSRSRRNTRSGSNASGKFSDTMMANPAEPFLSVPSNAGSGFQPPMQPVQNLSHHSLLPSNVSIGGSSVVNNNSLFPSHSGNSFLPNVQNLTPSVSLTQNPQSDLFYSTPQSKSVSDMTKLSNSINTKINLNTQFSPISDRGDLQSPSVFVPSYIMHDEISKHESNGSKQDSPNAIFPLDRSHSSVSLTAPSLTSQVSPVNRPSAGYLARALHQRSGSSDSVKSSGLSIGSSGFHNEMDPFSHEYMSSRYNQVNQQSLSAAPSISSLNDSLARQNAIPSLDTGEIKSAKGSSMFSSLFGSLKSKQFKKGARPEQSSEDSQLEILSSGFQQTGPINIQGSRERSSSLNSLPLSLGESFNPNFAGSPNPWTPVNVNVFGSMPGYSQTESADHDGWEHSTNIQHQHHTLDAKSLDDKSEHTDDALTTNSSSGSNQKSGLLQKGIRTFSLQRKTSAAISNNTEKSQDSEPETSKFSKRLSFFGSKESKEKNDDASSNSDLVEEKNDYHELLDRMRK